MLPPLPAGGLGLGLPGRVALRREQVAVERLRAKDPAIPGCKAKPCQGETLSLASVLAWR